MENEKINRSDLINRLAARTEFATKAEATRFVAALEAAFQDKLLDDRLVKIGGIGVFRLQWVEPRKSVDVRTGEAIEIAGHYKLAFVADTALKNALTAPVETPKVAPLQKLSEQADEIKDMLTDINGSAATDEKEQAESELNPESVESEPEQPQPEPVQSAQESETLGLNAEQREILRQVVNNVVAQPAPPKRKSIAWLWITLAVLLLCGGVAAYYFYGDVIRTWSEARWHSFTTVCGETWSEWFNSSKSDPAEESEPALPTLTDAEMQEQDIAEPVESDIFAQPRTYDSFIGSERIRQGMHLAVIAEKYYGHKDFWVYIYEANLQVLPNPNAVAVGTLVRLPKMDARLVDAGNPEAVAYAQQLATEYLQNVKK